MVRGLCLAPAKAVSDRRGIHNLCRPPQVSLYPFDNGIASVPNLVYDAYVTYHCSWSFVQVFVWALALHVNIQN